MTLDPVICRQAYMEEQDSTANKAVGDLYIPLRLPRFNRDRIPAAAPCSKSFSK